VAWHLFSGYDMESISINVVARFDTEEIALDNRRIAFAMLCLSAVVSRRVGN
jgi:hypothetical protein